MFASSGTLNCIRYASSYDAIFDAISGSPISAWCDELRSLRMSSDLRRVSTATPSGFETNRTGSPDRLNSTPWYVDGRNPGPQHARPPSGAFLPESRTTNPG